MADGGNNGKDVGGQVVKVQAPIVTVVFDPRTYKVEVTGNTPTMEFGKAMLQMAAEELGRQIAERRNEQRIARVSTEFLSGLKGP